MSFLGLCDGDPLVTVLKDLFGSNIVKVPEERIKPLCVVASSGRRTAFRGKLSPLLVGNPELNIQISSSRMADLSGKSSRKVNLALGLEILEGFLKGFGIPSAGINLKLQGAEKVSFHFKNVVRDFLDVNVLGKMLSEQIVDEDSPAASIFFGETAYAFLVIDSVITSSDFAINLEKGHDHSFKLDVPAIQTLVAQANAGMEVNTTTGYDLIFKGPEQLAFAFSCVKLYLDQAGRITSMPPAGEIPTLRVYFGRTKEHKIDYSPDRVLLNPEPAMLAWDE